MTKSLEQFNPTINIIDVGHGSAAVLLYENQYMIFDAGRGKKLLDFLDKNTITQIDAVVISHADIDHYGGITSVLLAENISIKKLFINADPTKKNNESHTQFRYAIQEAKIKKNTITEPNVTSSLTGKLDSKDLKIEVLYPSPEIAISGVSGTDLSGNELTSNSMSAIIRIKYFDIPRILFGSDMGLTCLEYFVENKAELLSEVLIYPHHGGLPGTAKKDEIEKFTEELINLVKPKHCIFSIHRTMHSLPRSEIINVITKEIPEILLYCTQLPEHIKNIVLSENPGPWKSHCTQKDGNAHYFEGNIKIILNKEGNEIEFMN